MKRKTIFLSFLVSSFVLGACTAPPVQVVVTQPGAEPTSAEQVVDVQPGGGAIFGWVLHDPDIAAAADEKAIGGVTVRLGEGACPATGLAEVQTIDTDISYSFNDLNSGTYCVSIDPQSEANKAILLPGQWVKPATGTGVIEQTVTLSAGEEKFDVNFFWDYDRALQQLQGALREIQVDDVSVEIGWGSPIPVTVNIAGTWPGLCAQLAELKQETSDSHFEITLMASADAPGCPEDYLGLPFALDIPLNMVEKPVGTYTVTVNGTTTSFEWDQRGATPSTEDSGQSQGSPFSFEGVSLTLDPDLAHSAAAEVIPAKAPLTPDGPYWDVNPEYVKMTLLGYPLSQTIFTPVISVYPIDQYRALDPRYGDLIDKLAALLNAKPDAPQEPIPFLPMMNAGQVFRSNVQYMDFQNGSGVRFLTILAQYYAPVNNYDLFYTFQGITSDGKHLVSMILPINHPTLIDGPSSLSTTEMEALLSNPNYYAEMQAALEAETPGSFTPTLGQLDALVQSLLVE